VRLEKEIIDVFYLKIVVWQKCLSAGVAQTLRYNLIFDLTFVHHNARNASQPRNRKEEEALKHIAYKCTVISIKVTAIKNFFSI